MQQGAVTAVISAGTGPTGHPPLLCAGTLPHILIPLCTVLSFCCPDDRVPIALLSRGFWPWGCPSSGHCRAALTALGRAGRARGPGCGCLWSWRGSRRGSPCPSRPPLAPPSCHSPASARPGPGCGPWAEAAPPGPTCARRLERGRRAGGGGIPPFLPASLPLPSPPRLSLGPRSAGTRCRWVPAPRRGRAARQERLGSTRGRCFSVLLDPSHRRGASAGVLPCPAAVLRGCFSPRRGGVGGCAGLGVAAGGAGSPGLMAPERCPAGETGTATRSEFPAVSLVPALPGRACAARLAQSGSSSASASMRSTRALAHGHPFRAILCNLLHLPLED